MGLIPLKKLSDWRLIKPMVGRLSRYKQIKMMTYHQGEHVALPLHERLKAIPSLLTGRSLWTSYVYKGYGDERNNIARLPQDPRGAAMKARAHPILPKEKAREVAQWNEQAASAKSDAFEHIENEPLPNKNVPALQNTLPASSDLLRLVRTVRTVKGQDTASNNADVRFPEGAEKGGSVEQQSLNTQQSSSTNGISKEAPSSAQAAHQTQKMLPPPIKDLVIAEDELHPPELTREVSQIWKTGPNPRTGLLIDITTPVSDTSAVLPTRIVRHEVYQAYHAKDDAPLTSTATFRASTSDTNDLNTNSSKVRDFEKSDSKLNTPKEYSSETNETKSHVFKAYNPEAIEFIPSESIVNASKSKGNAASDLKAGGYKANNSKIESSLADDSKFSDPKVNEIKVVGPKADDCKTNNIEVEIFEANDRKVIDSEADKSRVNTLQANDSKVNDSKTKARPSSLVSKQARCPAISTTAFGFVNKMIAEKKQAVPEAETRQYYGGANLKKIPTHTVPPYESLLISCIESSALNFFEIARAVSGSMSLEVCLGKVYIDGRHILKEYKTASFTNKDWSSIFQQYDGSPTPTLFTNLLVLTYFQTSMIGSSRFLDSLPLGRTSIMLSISNSPTRHVYFVASHSI